MRVLNTDAVPKLADAGIEATIEAVSREFPDEENFLGRLNSVISIPPISQNTFLQLYADIRALGRFEDIEIVEATIPDPVARPVAPGGIGASGAFFSTPTTGVYDVRVYLDGGYHHTEQNKDLASDRSIINTGFVTGNIMQLALVDGDGVVGWFGRVTIA